MGAAQQFINITNKSNPQGCITKEIYKEALKGLDVIGEIKRLCLRARIINQTVGKKLEKNPPPGWMPPEKRQKLMDIFKEIEELAK